RTEGGRGWRGAPPRSRHETKVRVEVADSRKHLGERRARAKPGGERGSHLVDGRARQPHAAAVSGVVRAAHGQVGEAAHDLPSAHRTADREMVTAAAMVRALTVAFEGAIEVACGEERHLVLHAQRDRGLVEGCDGGTDLAE